MNLLNVTVKQAVVVFTLEDQKEKMTVKMFIKWLDFSLSGHMFEISPGRSGSFCT